MTHTHKCPHCEAERSLRVPRSKHVVLVVTCPACGEMALLFEGAVLGLQKEVFESGDRDAISTHVAEIVAQLMEQGIRVLQTDQDDAEEDVAEAHAARSQRRRRRKGARREISDDEVRHFVRVELEQINDPEYFRRHFG